MGGQFSGAPLLLLHTTGAKSGAQRVNPVMYRADGDRLVIFASKAGADTNPDWFHNLRANPNAVDRLWEAQKRDWPGFAGYELKTARQIPVVILEPGPGTPEPPS